MSNEGINRKVEWVKVASTFSSNCCQSTCRCCTIAS